MTSSTRPAPAGTDLAAGTWVADPIHSSVSFRVRHMGIGRVRGCFTLTSATLEVDETGLAGGSVVAEIDAASVNTGEAPRDQHVRSRDFLAVEDHPTIGFVSTEVRDVSGSSFTVVGDLTLHGVTRRVELAVEHLGTIADYAGGERAAFAATTAISRAAFGVDIQLVFGAGNAVVADRIDIELDLEFVTDGAA